MSNALASATEPDYPVGVDERDADIMRHSSLFMLAFSPFLLGCAATEFVSRSLPPAAADNIHIYSHNEGTALNLIDKALSSCPEQTERAETACVAEALAGTSMTVRALAATIPGCSLGSICHYDHTTKRRLGLIPAYATVVRKDWRVTLDLRIGAPSAGLLPVTVTDRNAFVVPPVAAATVARQALPAR